jgi:hypothetical protein
LRLAVAEARKVEAENQQSEVGSQTVEVRGQKPEAKPEPTEDAGEDAEVATTTNEAVATNDNSAPPTSDDEGYVWPEGTEAATEAAVENGTAPEAVTAPLPTLDELVKRIPLAARETLDELFRARFVAVQRTSASSLKH